MKKEITDLIWDYGLTLQQAKDYHKWNKGSKLREIVANDNRTVQAVHYSIYAARQKIINGKISNE